MNNKNYQEIIKKYDKFKNNNLPTPFWDEERQVLEYVNYDSNNELNISSNIFYALGNLTSAGLYYSYTCGFFYQLAGECNYEFKIGHKHSHSFEEVVRDLYDFPENFRISSEEEQFYSKQELEYLKRVQKYLLFIGLKDINSYKNQQKRYKNKLQNKYENAFIYNCSDETINDFISGTRNFMVTKIINIEVYEKNKNYNRKVLIINKNYDFKLFIEFTHQEIKLYEEIKELYKDTKLKENDNVLIEYFKVIEYFK